MKHFQLSTTSFSLKFIFELLFSSHRAIGSCFVFASLDIMITKLLIICLISTACTANVPPTEEYPHQTDLDSSGNVILHWKFDDIYMTFEVSQNIL